MRKLEPKPYPRKDIAYRNMIEDWHKHIGWDRAAYLNLKEAVKRYDDGRETIFMHPETGEFQHPKAGTTVQYPVVYLRALLKHLEQKYKP